MTLNLQVIRVESWGLRIKASKLLQKVPELLVNIVESLMDARIE